MKLKLVGLFKAVSGLNSPVAKVVERRFEVKATALDQEESAILKTKFLWPNFMNRTTN